MVVYRNPDSTDAVDENSAELPISEAELTTLALQDSPPDDFTGSGPETPSSTTEHSGTGIVWLIGLCVIAIAGTLFVYSPKPPSHEVARLRSPDGAGDAVLVELAHDAAGLRSFRVCMQSAGGLKRAPNSCREVAYLGGVSSDNGAQPVMLIWQASSQLEIRCVHAVSIRVYQPVFTWSSSRYPTQGSGMRAILIKVVQTGV